MAETDLFIARGSFLTSLEGEEIQVHAGHTVVRAGHPLLAGREEMFMPLHVHYDVEQPKAAPARRRGES